MKYVYPNIKDVKAPCKIMEAYYSKEDVEALLGLDNGSVPSRS
jgi:hypothetical protein